MDNFFEGGQNVKLNEVKCVAQELGRKLNVNSKNIQREQCSAKSRRGVTVKLEKTLRNCLHFHRHYKLYVRNMRTFMNRKSWRANKQTHTYTYIHRVLQQRLANVQQLCGNFVHRSNEDFQTMDIKLGENQNTTRITMLRMANPFTMCGSNTQV